MLIEKIETIKTAMDINFTGARLLTKEEADRLPKRLKLYRNWWWTFNAADNDHHNGAWVVFGYRGYLHYDTVGNERAVRPALRIESKDLQIGDTFLFGGKEFEVIKEGLAFCTTDIGESAFRTDWKAEDANQYEASDIKKYIDKWFEENRK